MMAQARRPVFYTGGGVINSGPDASKDACGTLARETGVPVTSTLMGLGAYPASRSRNGSACWACMEALKRTTPCTTAILWSPSARGSTIAMTGRLDAFSPWVAERFTSMSIRPPSTKTYRSISAIIGDAGDILARADKQNGAIAKNEVLQHRRTPSPSWWEQINAVAFAKNSLQPSRKERQTIIKPQHAIERLYELTKDKNVIRHDGGRSASNVGGPTL